MECDRTAQWLAAQHWWGVRAPMIGSPRVRWVELPEVRQTSRVTLWAAEQLYRVDLSRFVRRRR